MDTPLIFWIGFNIAVLAFLAIDLFAHRQDKPISARDAAVTSVAFVVLSLLFGAYIWHWKGAGKAMEFFTGYIIEYSLSIDNIFIFVLVFGFFQVPDKYQHRVLFWGILGAFVMRGVMIGVGAALISRFHWILYIFGAFLVYTGIKMLTHGDEKVDMSKNPVLNFCRKHLPLSDVYHGHDFLARVNGKMLLTPLAVVLIVVECTDLIFAVDSIPAIFAITQDPFIVYTSNVCAILGLRSLYFLLAKAMTHFKYLKTGLGLVLSFIGVKMLIDHFYHIPTPAALGVVACILALAVVASLLAKESDK
jgi:tellurite resistance protein TerC